jgi:signal transduction histidine kinase
MDTREIEARRRERRACKRMATWAQILLALMVLSAWVIGSLNLLASSQRAEEIRTNSIRSERLLAEIRMGVQTANVLVLMAAEPGADGLQGTRDQVSALRLEVATAIREYRSLTDYPYEAEGWSRLQALLRQNGAHIDRFLYEQTPMSPAELSRWRIELARVAIDVAHATEAQVEINRQATERLSQEQQHYHGRTMIVLLWILVVSVLYTEWLLARAVRKIDSQALLIEEQLTRLSEILTAREDLVASASHELRTPVTAMLLVAERLRRVGDDCDYLERDRLLSHLRLQARRADRTLGRLLDAVDFVSGRVPLYLEPVDLPSLARSVIAELEDLRSSYGSEVSLESPTTLQGRWDRIRLGQVLEDLISNALKYGSGRPISVRLWVTEGEAHIEVRDHGRGIAPKDQKKIFERFGRALPGHRSSWGFGLGLWFVRMVLEALDGTVEVQSQLEEGSTFLARLPLLPSGSPPEPPEPSEPPKGPSDQTSHLQSPSPLGSST